MVNHMNEEQLSKSTEIHVDDYAISINASKAMLALIRQDKVNGISIIPNVACYQECLGLLIPVLQEKGYDRLKVSVHLNLMEGKPCSNLAEVPDLIDEDGYLDLSWGSLLLNSYHLLRYQKIKNQLKKELYAQIKMVIESLPDGYRLRIDSHQHTHVLPIVFSALKEVIQENQLEVEYIRVPCEPLHVYFKHLSLIRTYSIVNIVKNIVLNLYGTFMKGWIKRKKIQSSCLWGVVMSGKMDGPRVEKLLDDFLKYAGSKKLKLEILFHGGSVLPEEITKEYSKQGFRDFHLSQDRRTEWEAIDSLGNQILGR